MLEAIRLARDEMNVEIGASPGLLTGGETRILTDEDVSHYSHDTKISPRYFDKMVETHDLGDRPMTLRQTEDAGMDLCVGIILGMSGTPANRTGAALELQEIGVESLPVNMLGPVPDTLLGGANHVDIATIELAKTAAVYRLLYPDACARLTGGREVSLAPGKQCLPFEVDADDILIGNYPTTDSQSPAADIGVAERTGLGSSRVANDFDVDVVKRREARDG